MDELAEKLAKAVRGLADNPNAGHLLEEFAGWASDDDVALLISTALASIQEDDAIVPRDPTEAMIAAGWHEIEYRGCRAQDAADAYTAMISAAERTSHE